MRFGSRRWKWDPRERGFSHRRFYGAADLSVLPREGLKRPRRPIENQGMTLRCTAYAGAVANGYIHGLRFHPDWQAKKIGQKQGRNVDENGADPKAAMSSLRDDGSLIIDLWPLTLANGNTEVTANWSSYPDNLDKNAKDFRALAYFGVDDAFDLFDDVRYALWRAYDPNTGKGAVVQAFSPWYSEWGNAGTRPALVPGIVPTTYNTFLGYHAYTSSTGARSGVCSISSLKIPPVLTSVTKAFSTSRARS